MLVTSPAVAAIVGAVVGVVVAVVGRAAEPALVVTSCAAAAALVSTRMRRRGSSADDRLVANSLVLLNLVTLAWALVGWGGVLVALAVLGRLGGLGAASGFFARRRHG